MSEVATIKWVRHLINGEAASIQERTSSIISAPKGSVSNAERGQVNNLIKKPYSGIEKKHIVSIYQEAAAINVVEEITEAVPNGTLLRKS
jgi:hypothetical protein